MSLLSPCLDRGCDSYSEVAVTVASKRVSNLCVLNYVAQSYNLKVQCHVQISPSPRKALGSEMLSVEKVVKCCHYLAFDRAWKGPRPLMLMKHDTLIRIILNSLKSKTLDIVRNRQCTPLTGPAAPKWREV